MRYLRAVAAAMLVATALCAPAAVANDDPRVDARWERLRAGGYEPLTIPVCRWLREWRGDPLGEISPSALILMASGLGQGDAGFGFKIVPENAVVRHGLRSDFTRMLLALPREREPELGFDHNNQVSQALEIVLELATGERYVRLLSERLWRPLGLADAAMPRARPVWMPMVGCCAFSRPIDWVRIGQLFIDGGQRVYVMPDKRLVVVRAARDGPAAWDDALLLKSVWRGTAP